MRRILVIEASPGVVCHVCRKSSARGLCMSVADNGASARHSPSRSKMVESKSASAPQKRSLKKFFESSTLRGVVLKAIKVLRSAFVTPEFTQRLICEAGD